MLRRSYLIVAAVAVATAWYLYAEFDNTRSFVAPISMIEGAVVVRNATDREWRNVVVTVNHHFHGGAPSLAAGGRLHAPLSQFVTGFGQRYDRSRQSVFKVEVTATDTHGQAVRLDWEARKRR
jgi:hypothetical protein